MSTDKLKLKTVAVLGGSYGGECLLFVTLHAIQRSLEFNYSAFSCAPAHSSRIDLPILWE